MSATEQAIGGGRARRGYAADPLLHGMQRLALLAERASEPEQVFRALAQELSSALDADEIHVHHLGGEPSHRELVVVYVNDGEGRLSYHCTAAERPPAVGWVASTGRSFLASGERELLAGLPSLTSGPAAAHCALLVPLQSATKTVTVIVLVARDAARFQDASIERAAVLVDQAAAVLALLRARAEAGTDAVTGCMNHRAMRRRLGEEVARAERSHRGLSCLLIDLDDFKLVNDRHGHQAGDELLRMVAETLMREFRSFDRVARYGGDEFVVILPDADLDSATVAAERALARLGEISISRPAQVRRAVARAGTPTRDSPDAGEPSPFISGIGASIGVAEWQDSMSVESLLEECDSALLRGKREGKRRVTLAR